jgi:hypothetical protein
MSKAKSGTAQAPKHYPVPLIEHDGYSWGALSYFGNKQIISGESMRIDDNNYTFRGGHRVRLYEIKNNIYWRIKKGIDLDISAVEVADAPRRAVR